MTQYIDKAALIAEMKKRYEYWREKEHNSHSIESEIRMSECQHLMFLLNNIEEKEHISRNLNIAAREYSYIKGAENIDEYAQYDFEKYNAFKAGAKWQSKQMQSIIELAKDINTFKAGFELGLKVQKGE